MFPLEHFVELWRLRGPSPIDTLLDHCLEDNLPLPNYYSERVE